MKVTGVIKTWSYRDTTPGILRLVVLLWIATWAFRANAQQYTFIPYSLKEGLAQSQVRCMFQDSRGFIWAGTLGGLSRFDGKTFLNYDRQSGLTNNQVTSVIELRSGVIAAGCNGSIALVNALGVKSISLADSFQESAVNTLYEDEQGVIWIGTEHGLCTWNGREATPVSGELGKAHIKAFHYQQKTGNLLIVTKEKIFSLRGETIEPFFTPANPETNFFDITATSDGTLWLATRGEGLVRLNADGGNATAIQSGGILPITITGLITTRENELYISSRFGFYKFSGSVFEAYTDRNGLPTADVRDIMEDREGNIWLGTYGSGILRFTGELFTSYNKADSLVRGPVMSILQDQRGDYWFSTFDQGIRKMQNGVFSSYQQKDQTVANRIWNSLCDHEGTLWFASSDGLFRYKNDDFAHYTSADSLPADMVLSLYEDRSHRIWIGTSRGLCLLQDGVFTPITDTAAPSRRVRCIREDKAGHMWFATNEGVYRFDGVRYVAYTTDSGLPDNSTNSVEIDEFNHVWIGTQNGLAVLSGERFSASDIHNKPGSDVVNFLRYHRGILWIGTNNGLHSATVGESLDEKNLVFTHYGLEDGLRSMETNLNAVYLDWSGNLWFGTTDGVTKVETSELGKKKRPVAPLLSLAGIQINLQDQDWTKLSVRVDSVSGLALNPRLDYRKNHITFYFTSLSTTYPEDVQYQYKMEGLDDDWKPLTKNNFATYSNLPFEHFTFYVKALGKDGLWSAPVVYRFSIAPPFWLTWWFITLEVVAALSVVAVVVYNRRRAVVAKRQKEWFEIRSRMLALEQQSLNSSMNRHFIFNALNSIQYYINRQDRLAANRYLSDFARLIRKNLDSSGENLTTLRDEIERLELYLKLEHMRFKDKFEYSINVDPTLNQDTVKVPAMLVQPFLENSIWHGLLPQEVPGRVEVNITRKNGHIEFTITDNGIGIENSLKNKTGTDNHISKGMEITQSRIELIQKTTGQTIELRGPYQIQEGDSHPTGTRVQIILPENFHELFST